jgi:hypothetical protein
VVEPYPEITFPFPRTGVIVTPPVFSFFTRTCETPRIFAGFDFFRNRVNAALRRFVVLAFFLALF